MQSRYIHKQTDFNASFCVRVNRRLYKANEAISLHDKILITFCQHMTLQEYQMSMKREVICDSTPDL